MKQLLSSILLALVVGFYTIPAFAQEEGVANVTVMVCDADGNVVAKSKTDRDGKFDISVTKAHSDYYLQIDEKDRKSKIAIKEQGVRTVSGDVNGDGAASAYEFYLQVDPKTGYSVKSPRDAASGQATGKRQHGAITITKEWSRCAISIDEPGVHLTGQIYGMAINEKGLPGEKKPVKSTK
jgi:hypothetical protein